MIRRISILCIVAGCLLAQTGCRKLTFNKTANLGPGEVQQVASISPPTYGQKVSVTITPKDGPVSAYLCKSSDDDAVRKALDQVKQEPAAGLLLASKPAGQAAEAFTLEASIPAKTGYSLWLRGGSKTTEVKIDLVGK
ncbi:MAG: hypothetical protein U0840_22220 [Gemmataceae bacterium]